MEDKRILENISDQIRAIESNMNKSMENINSIEILLHSNNNGAPKDAEMSKIFSRIKEQIQASIDATNEFMSTLNHSKR